MFSLWWLEVQWEKGQWYASGELVIHQKVSTQPSDHLRAVAIFKYNTEKKHCCLWNCTVRTVKIYPQAVVSDWSNPRFSFFLFIFLKKSLVCGWVMIKQKTKRKKERKIQLYLSIFSCVLLMALLLSQTFIHSDS